MKKLQVQFTDRQLEADRITWIKKKHGVGIADHFIRQTIERKCCLAFKNSLWVELPFSVDVYIVTCFICACQFNTSDFSKRC